LFKLQNINLGLSLIMKKWFPIIGLEIHAQLNTSSKLFSKAGKNFLAPTNSCVSNLDASMPGSLPVINKRSVELAVATSLALNCQVNYRSIFERKHYFYGDMPQGYQITQQRHPIANGGYVEYMTSDEVTKKADIKQVQIEQDSGKSLHEEDKSLICLNRAGVGLVEIVTSPSFRTSDEACSFVRELMLILQYAESCKAKMEEGEFRVDANISVSGDTDKLGTRTEVKNINRFSGIKQAIDYEIERQIEILENGGKVLQETRGLTSDGTTKSQRKKETSYDYRFMYDGNLPPLLLHNDNTIHDKKNAVNVDNLRRNLKKLPTEYRKKLFVEFNLSKEAVDFILENHMADYYIAVIEHQPAVDKKLTFDFIRVNLLPYLEKNKLCFKTCPLKADDLSDLLNLAHTYQIDGRSCGEAFKLSLHSDKTPLQIVEENNWYKVNDENKIDEWCTEVIGESLQEINEILVTGKAKKQKKFEQKSDKLLGRLCKKVYSKSDGNAHAKLVRMNLKKKLNTFSLDDYC